MLLFHFKLLELLGASAEQRWGLCPPPIPLWFAPLRVSHFGAHLLRLSINTLVCHVVVSWLRGSILWRTLPTTRPICLVPIQFTHLLAHICDSCLEAQFTVSKLSIILLTFYYLLFLYLYFILGRPTAYNYNIIITQGQLQVLTNSRTVCTSC